MKYLCRRSEHQSFAGTAFQSVFDHFNFLVSNTCHPALLGHIFLQQAIKVLVGATLPTGKGLGEVARAVQRLINLGMPAKLFAVLVCHGIDLGFKGY